VPRILILYGTTDGHTAKISAALAETLRLDGAFVDVVDAGARVPSPGPEQYTAIIVAASVHASGYQSSVRRWVAANVRALRDRPTAFVSVCLGVLQHDPTVDRELQAILHRFYRLTGWQPAVTKIVAGALLYTRYGWLKRLVMRRIAAKAQGDVDTSRDYEYTDWTDLKGFARDFLLRVEQPDATFEVVRKSA
jgi:menaquinone-dependent protoporphyrinogen oxidase